jgi:hypothetical protein
MKFVYRRRGKKGNEEEGGVVYINPIEILERRNDEGIEELMGTDGITNCNCGSQGVEGSMGLGSE